MKLKYSEGYMINRNNTVSIQEAANRLGYVYSRVYTLVSQGRIKSERSGREWLIPISEIERYRNTPHIMGRPRISDNIQGGGYGR